jgi:hypothetical protein
VTIIVIHTHIHTYSEGGPIYSPSPEERIARIKADRERERENQNALKVRVYIGVVSVVSQYNCVYYCDTHINTYTQ